jgi:predicted metal-dependent hydrolase
MRAGATAGKETISYELLLSPSRKTLTIEVHPDCRVVVRAPTATSSALIESRVRRRRLWIRRQIMEFQAYLPRSPGRQHISGESHLFLGRQYRLRLRTAPRASVAIHRPFLTVSLPSGSGSVDVKSALERWYRAQAEKVFRDTLLHLYGKLSGASQPRLIVRTMKTRWGSLSPAGNLTLNVDLVRAPLSCIEYVVAHELCHMSHRRHDARFYRQLALIIPDWERRKRRLETVLL